MRYPLLASILLFSLLLMFLIHRTRNNEAKRFQEFLDEETRANSTRKKPLDNLNYITIPFETLPFEVLKDDEKIAEFHNILRNLSESPIVNFTGITNTELKLQYGAPNIEKLSRYDECYTILVRTLDKWAKSLYENDYMDEAQRVLEFAVDTGTDISSSYMLLSDIYMQKNEPLQIDGLISKAEGLNSLMKKNILQELNQRKYPNA